MYVRCLPVPKKLEPESIRSNRHDTTDGTVLKMEISFLFFIPRFVIFHSLSSRSKVKVLLCVQTAIQRGWNTIFHSKKLKNVFSKSSHNICAPKSSFAFFGVWCHWERNAFLQNKNNNFCFHQLFHNRAAQANWKTTETSLVTYFPKSSRNGAQQKYNQISKQSPSFANFLEASYQHASRLVRERFCNGDGKAILN